MKLIKPTSCVLDKEIYECLESEAVMKASGSPLLDLFKLEI